MYRQLRRFYSRRRLLRYVAQGKWALLMTRVLTRRQVIAAQLVARQHQKLLRRREASYYGPNDELDEDALIASPIITMDLHPQTYIPWEAPSPSVVPLQVKGETLATTSQ